ncbi:armadillo-type protein [Blastocladiella britannica]|nr:armadillo-type protein [Blastocladiella britannica]
MASSPPSARVRTQGSSREKSSGTASSTPGSGKSRTASASLATEGSESFSFNEWESALGVPTDLLADDGRGIHELKISNKLYKRKEEIDMYCIDESLGELDRALHIIRRGQPVQMFSVIANFNRLVGSFPHRALDELFPAILASAAQSVANEDYHETLCKFLLETLEKLPAESQLIMAIFEVSQAHAKSDKEFLVEQWSNVYLACLTKGLPMDLLCEIVKVAILEGGFTQPAPCRVWCAKVLGAATSHFTSGEIQTLFLEKALSLCQDTDLEVRSCMGQQLAPIMRALDIRVACDRVIPEFLELVTDEELAVQQSALHGMGHVLKLLPDEVKRKIIAPVWASLLAEESLLPILSKEFGRFFWHCKDSLCETDMARFLAFYLDLANSQEPEVRLNCIYNFPAVLKAIGPDLRLISVLERLVSGPIEEIRLKVAECLPVIMGLLRGSCYQLLRPTFFALFAEQEPVFAVVLANMNDSVQHFMQDETFKRGTDMNDLLFILFRRLRDLISKAKWQLAFQFLQESQHFHEYFDPDQVYDVCVPVLLRIISESKRVPLSELAIHTLLLQARRFRHLEQRDSACRSLVSDLAFSSDHRARLLYIHVCSEALTLNSARFFRQYFAHALLSLATDSVLGIRRKLALLLPRAAVAIMAPAIPFGAPLPISSSAQASAAATAAAAAAASAAASYNGGSATLGIVSIGIRGSGSMTQLMPKGAMSTFSDSVPTLSQLAPPSLSAQLCPGPTATGGTSASSHSLASEETLVKKLTTAVDSLASVGLQLVGELANPPVREDAAEWDHDREQDEDLAIREDVEDSRRKSDIPSSDSRRQSIQSSGALFAGGNSAASSAADAKDRKRNSIVCKPSKGAGGTARVSTAGGSSTSVSGSSSSSGPASSSSASSPASTSAAAAGGKGGLMGFGSAALAPITANTAQTGANASLYPGASSGTAAAGSTGGQSLTSMVSGIRRPRLRSANTGSADVGGGGALGGGIGDHGHAPITSKPRSGSNSTLNYAAASATSPSVASTTSPSSSSNSLRSSPAANAAGAAVTAGTPRRPSIAAGSDASSSSSGSSSSSRRPGEKAVKLPALSKSAVGGR